MKRSRRRKRHIGSRSFSARVPDYHLGVPKHQSLLKNQGGGGVRKRSSITPPPGGGVIDYS